MKVLMFQHRFALKVKDGSKPHTIRPERKNPIKVGDRLSLRKWTDKAYRSPQIVLREAVCNRLEFVSVMYSDTGRPFVLEGEILSPMAANLLARQDGFTDSAEMTRWFDEEHGLPFFGVLIGWEP